MSGLRDLCLFKATWQNVDWLASHRWRADSPEMMGAEEEMGLCGWSGSQMSLCQPTQDRRLLFNEAPLKPITVTGIVEQLVRDLR